MKFLKQIGKLFNAESENHKNHPQDIKLEQQESESALAEIELRDR